MQSMQCTVVQCSQILRAKPAGYQRAREEQGLGSIDSVRLRGKRRNKESCDVEVQQEVYTAALTDRLLRRTSGVPDWKEAKGQVRSSVTASALGFLVTTYVLVFWFSHLCSAPRRSAGECRLLFRLVYSHQVVAHILAIHSHAAAEQESGGGGGGLCTGGSQGLRCT